LAKAEKYRIEFYNTQNSLCIVSIRFEGFTGVSTKLQPASKPFTLGEFNQLDDLFKPIRPQLATIQFIGNDTITIDDFIVDNDNDIEVIFTYGAYTNYWIGYLLQDNFQETWQDTNHIITLTASEGLGLLEYEQFNNNGVEVVGRLKVFDALQYCVQPTPLTFVNSRIVSNLFHSSMDDTGTNIPLDQCYIDARSFQIEAREFDTKKVALEKINTAFSQTLFQYYGDWFIYRLEELYTPSSSNLRQVRMAVSRTSTNTRYDINVGVEQEVKPVSPDMIRYIKRKTKRDITDFYYQQFNEVIENESFTRGEEKFSNEFFVNKDLDSWTYETGTFSSPTTPTGPTADYGIAETYENGLLVDTYAFFNITAQSGAFWIKSSPVPVNNLQTIDLQFEVAYGPGFPSGKKTTFPCWVFLNGVLANYQLLNTGKWEQVAGSVPTKAIELDYDSNKEPVAEEFNAISVQSDRIPDNGDITVYFYAQGQTGMVDNLFKIKNLVLGIKRPFQVDGARRNILGEKLYYEKSANLRIEDKFELYFGDNFSQAHKGTIYEPDGLTICDESWYRLRFPTETMPFRKEALIAHWENNRFNRNKIDATFYGLTYDTNKPIGLMNTIKFVDDDANKVYAILNLKEIDFSSCIWSATLIEVYDSEKDSGTPATNTFSTDVIDGTYTNQTYVPMNITSAADFIANSSDTIFSYTGDDSITVNITCNVGGYVNNAPTPSTQYLRLQKNGTDIQTYAISVNTLPEPFNATLSVNSILIKNQDNLSILIDSGITEIELSTGGISFTYTDAVPFVYDPYYKEYLSN
jgi:hypothetical protein